MPEFEHTYRGIPEVPAIIENPLTGIRVEVNLVVDTGAEATMLDEGIARILGIELDSSTKVDVLGLGGSRQRMPHANVAITPSGQEDLQVALDAVFVPRLAERLGNLLGLDFFEHVDLSLAHRDRVLIVQRHP